jgi:hypothetical protein
MGHDVETTPPKWNNLWLLLLLIPFIALLWPAFYSSTNPSFEGIPFFYWYQFLWVILGSAVTGLVYFLVRR